MMSESGNDRVFSCMGEDFVFKIDSQRRVPIPSDWRGESPDGVFFIIPGKESTLQLYPSNVFKDKIMPKLSRLSPANPDDLRKLRQLGSQILKCSCDKQGRIQLTPSLMSHAHLTDSLAWIGSLDFAQGMDGSRWESEKNAKNESDNFLDIIW